MMAIWSSPSACARRTPVSAPGGRTTTQRLGRPSLVVAGESSASSNPSAGEEADRLVVVLDDNRDKAQVHRVSLGRWPFPPVGRFYRPVQFPCARDRRREE